MKRPRKQQQHPHQTTNRSKKNPTRSRTIHLEITAEQLVERGNLQEAVHLLRAHIRTTPSDEKQRLLGRCLFQLGDSREAAQAWLAIQEKTARDLALVGLAFLDLEEWEQTVLHLQASLQLEERGYCYYWLALAHKKSGEDYQLEAEERASILDLLRKACALPACPAEAFLWLDNLVRRAGNADERTTLLQEAFARYPNVEDVRLRLGDHLLYHLLNYEGALMMVKPLLAQPTPPQEAVACAFWAAQQAGRFEEALAYTECMHVSPYRHCGPSMAKVKGDLYLIAGKTDEAIAYYEQETQSGDFEGMFIGYFCIAKAWLTQGQVSKAAAAATQGATLWFANPNSSQCDGVFDPEPFSIGTETDQAHIGEHFSRCVKEVCEALLAEEQGAERSLKGQLSYLLYHYYTEYRPDETGETLTELLLQAAQWFEHPHMSQDLAYHYLGRGDVPLAVRHHLMYSLWQFSTLKTYQPLPPVSDDTDESRSGRWYKRQWEFRSSTAEFTIGDETEEDEGAAQQIQDMSVDVRHECHEIAWKFLQAHQDSDIIIAVFLPFYRSFWHDILVAGDMSQELVDILALLLNVSPAADTDDELWSYAYTLSELGRADEAERAYRSYLERHPDHAATLHNLALLVKERGLLQEALTLSNQAAALAPNNEIIVQVNSSLKREYEERERPHGNTAEQDQLRTSSQERAHLWPLLSDSQKRLLCLMELYPVAHWSALLPHVKNDEQQLRQLQEDWEWLLEHGACLQAEADTSVRAIPLLQPCVLEEGFRYWLSAEIARVQARKKKDLWLPDASGLEDEQLAELSSTQRDLLQQALMRRIERVASSGMEQFHLRFYRRIWKQLLIEWKMYDALVDLCEQFLSRLSVMTREELWECAFYATDLSGWPYRNIAEKRYQEYLAQEKSYAAYHNLSLIYLRENKYRDALQMIEHALQLNPSNEKSINQKARIEQAIQKEEEKQAQLELQRQREKAQREQRFKDLEPKIQDHLAEVDYYKQNILRTLETATFYSKRSFAKRVGMEEWALNGHWRKLAVWGMIIEENRQPIVHPLISTYLEQGWPVISGSSVKPKEPKVPEASSVVVNVKELVMGDQIRNQIGDISNISGQLFIGKFNNVIASLNRNGQAELAEALKTLEEAVMASGVLLDGEKQERVEVINHIGEEAAKPKPNKTFLKVLSDGLMTTLRGVPDVAKAVTAVAPAFAQWHH
jgi:tetratricopeptide (TPR) repeat protein